MANAKSLYFSREMTPLAMDRAMHHLSNMKANGQSASAAAKRQNAKTKRERRPARASRPPEVEARVAAERNGNMGAGAVSGALAGAAAGVVAGPAGAVAGGAIGAVAGAVAGAALAEDHEKHLEEDEELDREIGVTAGSMGAPNLKHPPAKVGAFSKAAAGGAPVSTPTPASGPISGTDE